MAWDVKEREGSAGGGRAGQAEGSSPTMQSERAHSATLLPKLMPNAGTACKARVAAAAALRAATMRSARVKPTRAGQAGESSPTVRLAGAQRATRRESRHLMRAKSVKHAWQWQWQGVRQRQWQRVRQLQWQRQSQSAAGQQRGMGSGSARWGVGQWRRVWQRGCVRPAEG